MSKVTVNPGESLDIVAKGVHEAVRSSPEVFLAFVEIVAYVNQRFIDSNTNTKLKLIPAK